MLGAVLYGWRDVRFEKRDAPTFIKPTGAIIAGPPIFYRDFGYADGLVILRLKGDVERLGRMAR